MFKIACLNLLINYKTCRFLHLSNIVVGFIPFLVLSILLFVFYKRETKVGVRTAINTIVIILLTGKMSEAIGNELYKENSDSFRMYILGATKLSGDGYWNHGIEYGVIINKDKHRVTYFNEYW